MAAKDGRSTSVRVAIDSVDTIGHLIDFGAVEIHLFGCRAESVGRPERLAFNLKPDADLEWRIVVDAALRLRDVLRRHGLKPDAQVSGGRELHVIAALGRRRWSWPQVERCAQEIARELIATDARYTETPSSMRRGRLLVDAKRSGYNQTLIAPYSPVAAPDFPVAHPVTWSQVEEGISPSAFTMKQLEMSAAGNEPRRVAFAPADGEVGRRRR